MRSTPLGLPPSRVLRRVPARPAAVRVRPSPLQLRGSRHDTHFLTETWFQSAHPVSSVRFNSGSCLRQISLPMADYIQRVAKSYRNRNMALEASTASQDLVIGIDCVTGAGETVLCRELVTWMPHTHLLYRNRQSLNTTWVG